MALYQKEGTRLEGEGFAFLSVNKSGIDWFDEILSNDKQLLDAVQGFDLVGVSVRMKELRELHGITIEPLKD